MKRFVLVLLTACPTKESPPAPPVVVVEAAAPSVDASVVGADAGAGEDAEVDAGRCDGVVSSKLTWFVVHDRNVDRTVNPPKTTIEPGVYPMLMVASALVKMWSHFWLPKEKRRFSSCRVVPPADRAGFPAQIWSAIRCDGAASMYFVTLPEDGYVGVQEALVPPKGTTPVWTSVPSAKKDDPKWPAECATMQTPEISVTPYMKDLSGPRTFP